jgi:hypothetical protein
MKKIIPCVKQETESKRNGKIRLIDHMLDRSRSLFFFFLLWFGGPSPGATAEANERTAISENKMDWIAAAVAAMRGRRRQRRRLGSRDDRANTFRGEFDLAVAQNKKIPPLEKKTREKKTSFIEV